MEQIIYISTARAPLRVSQEQIDEILEVSRRNNARDGLSGLLVTGGRRFLQVLEGPSEMLDAAYARIKEDPRHFALVQLARRPISERGFPAWDMGFETDQRRLAEVVTELGWHVRDPMLRAQLDGFAELHGRAA